MAGYTLVNVKDVEDQAVKFGFAPDMEARFARGELELERAGVSYQRLAPGFRQPFGHRHKTQEEIYVFLSGGGRAKLDDEIIDVGTLDALRVPPETARCFEGGSEGLEFIAFGAPNTGPAGEDVEQLPGWWAD
jgi:mannose-6-phosphate isomerase-like protein (cupin superfamily)